MISIIIPAYNVGKYIEKTITSCSKQTNSNYEVIIIDDGSTDNTYEVVMQLLDDYDSNRFKCIRTLNSGVSSSRNTGIKNAIGEYILFLDGDDTINETLVQDVINSSKNDNADIIVFGFDKVGNENTLIESYFSKYSLPKENTSGSEALLRNIVKKEFGIWTGSAVYKKSLLTTNNIFFTETCISGEDTEFILKALINSDCVAYIKKSLSNYYIREGSVTNSYNIRRLDLIYAIIRVQNEIKGRLKESDYIIVKNALNEIILSSYTRTINSCLLYKTKEGISINESIELINCETEQIYPTLRNDLRYKFIELIKARRISKTIIKYFVLNINPAFFIKLFN